MNEPNELNNYISIKDFCREFKITTDTYNNWLRTKIIDSTEVKEKKISLKELNRIKTDINNGMLSKLKYRANKLLSDKNIIPKESLTELKLKLDFTLFQNFSDFDFQHLKIYIFLNILFFLEKKEWLNPGEKIRTIFNSDCENKITKKIGNIIKKSKILNPFKTLVDLSDKNQIIMLKQLLNYFPIQYFYVNPIYTDYWGIILQYLTKESAKSGQGAYYTPKKTITEMVERNLKPLLDLNKKTLTICDPCCGTGRFLIESYKFAKKNNPMQKIRYLANDTNQQALLICKVRFDLIKYFDHNLDYIDYCEDYIISNQDFRSDLYISNPPWGAHLTKDQKKEYSKFFPKIKSGEICSYILQKSLDNLQKEGRLSFLLPEAVFTVKKHEDIRNILFYTEKINIVRLTAYHKIFHQVFSNVTCLDLQFAANNPDDFIFEDKKNAIIRNDNLDKEHFNYSRLTCSKAEASLLNKLDNKYQKLKDIKSLEFGMGIVTGHNKSFVKELEPGKGNTLDGKSLDRFIYRKPKLFLNIDQDFDTYQQKQPLKTYLKQPKLIYKFISSQPVFALDYQGIFILNSCNYLISENQFYDCEILSIILNSELISYYFKNSFKTVKILKSHLLELPIPKKSILIAHREELKKLLKSFLATKDNQILTEINKLVFKCYGLNNKEMELIRNEFKGN